MPSGRYVALLTQQYAALPDAGKLESFPKQNLAFLFTAASSETLDLLGACLRYDPLKRVRASEALHHAYFRAGPLPTPPAHLPRPAQSAEEPKVEIEAPPAPVPAAPKAAGGKRALTDDEIAHRKRLAHRVAFS